MQKEREPETKTAFVKYIFLDVIEFTRDRSVEAQSDIVYGLNEIVRAAVIDNQIPDEARLYLPTGDGVCIALLRTESLPYDIHLKVALTIVTGVGVRNSRIEDGQCKFKIRVGLNENTDNLITDVNGNLNVAGDGINTAQRIMSMADGNQIIVSQAVFTSLGSRDKYMTSFRALPQTSVKHDKQIQVYQFIGEECQGLNRESPTVFQGLEQSELKLSKFTAYYFAHAIKNRKYISSLSRVESEPYACVILLYILAKSSEKELTGSGYKEIFGAQLHYYLSIRPKTLDYLANLIVTNVLQDYSSFFEHMGFSILSFCFINQRGKDKLRREWPDVWREFSFADI